MSDARRLLEPSSNRTHTQTSRLWFRLLFSSVLVALVCAIVMGVSQYLAWLAPPDAEKLRDADIYAIWRDGGRLADGENPYNRILSSDMQRNRKYATYFPLFYVLGALTQLAGLRDFAPWLALWRSLFWLFDGAIAAMLLYAFYSKRLLGVGVVAALFWLLSRWSLVVATGVQIDFLPIAFLVASLLLFDRHRTASLIFLGISLAFKQIGLLVVPLYLAWLYQSPRTERRSQLLRDIGLIALVPLAVSLPFIMWHPEAFVKSILFSVTRRDTVSIVAPALGSMLGLRGTIARIPLAVMLLLAYAAAFRYRLGRYSSVLLIIAIFVSFNPILFDQYFTWLLPFVPLALYDAAQPQLSRGEPADA